MLRFFAKGLRTLHEVKREERGFTLIELLVVIIIVGLLAAIAIPLYLAQRGRAHEAAVESDARNAATAYIACYADTEAQASCDTDVELHAWGFNTTEFVEMTYGGTANEPVITATWNEGGAGAPVAQFDGATGRTTLIIPAP